ncbi:MAG: c-type cytochrome [Gammaproteobacteria bacterium]
MPLHDDRTFLRHFSWVILGLVATTIVFIILSFAIVGASGINDHSGYSYVQYMRHHPGAAPPGSAGYASNSAIPNSGLAAGQKAGSSAAASNGGAKAVAANGAKSGQSGGKAIWHAHCAACHATGVAGAPKIGDKKEWGPILAKTDTPTLYKHAINGFKGDRGYMPPKGGAASLTDAEVKAAASYMILKSGGAKTSTAAATTGMVAAKGAAPNGQSIWQAHCAACHATGVAGAPKIGDKQAWGPILAKTDMPTLYKRAINGYQSPRGFMPPKGGASSLSDVEVQAAVNYMVSKSGGKPGG